MILFVCLGIFHNNAAYHVGYVFAGVGASLQINVYFMPGNNFNGVFRLSVEAVHVVDIESVGLFLQRIYADNLLAQFLGTLEMGELLHQLQKGFAAAGYDLGHRDDVGTNRLNMGVVDADQ